MRLADRWRDFHPTYARNVDVARAASLLRGMQIGIAVVCVFYALAISAVTLSEYGPQDGVPTLVTLGIALAALVAAVAWWRGPWPSVATSLWFVIGAEMAHTVLLFFTTGAMLALFATLWFALIGEYLTYVHSRMAVGLHCLWALSVIVFLTTVALRGPSPQVALIWYVAAALVGALVAIPFLRQLSTEWLRESSRRAAAMADRDALTDLLNHRGMRAALPQLLARAPSRDVALVGIVIDLDQFKRINDTYGHHRGDEVLRRVSHRIAATVRRDAVVARTGGEEFVVLDTLADPDIAISIAERLRAAIPGNRTTGDSDVVISGSVGYALIPLADVPLDESHRLAMHNVIQDLLRRADQAMYRAKRLGGNRVMAFDLQLNSEEDHPSGRIY